MSCKPVKNNCDDCKGFFQCNRVKMSKNYVETLATENMIWRRVPCATSRRKSINLESKATYGGGVVSTK